jgi:membrane associated rhomboid family serine protease
LIQKTGDQFLGTHLFSVFGLTSSGFFQDHYYWQIFTYAFLHSEVIHLFLNLMILALLGSELEQAWGSTRFFVYYFFCLISTAVVYLIMFSVLSRDSAYFGALVGASGALYGLFTAYGLIFGERVLLFMMVFPMKAKHFIWVLAALQLMTTIYTPGGAWASLAGLTGMGAGFVFLWVRARWILNQKSRGLRSLSRSPSGGKKKKARHLKLVSSKSGDLDRLDSDSGEHPRTWH